MCFTVQLSNTPLRIVKKSIEVGANNVFTTEGRKFSTGGRALYSTGANTCLLVGLNAGKHNCLMHLAPEQQPISNLEESIDKYIRALQEKCDKIQETVSAILFGGREFRRDDVESKASFDLFNTMANILDKLEVPFSMICGKKKGAPVDNIYMQNNTASLWNNSINCLNKLGNASQKEIEDALYENYQVVEISPEVPVKVM